MGPLWRRGAQGRLSPQRNVARAVFQVQERVGEVPTGATLQGEDTTGRSWRRGGQTADRGAWQAQAMPGRSGFMQLGGAMVALAGARPSGRPGGTGGGVRPGW